MYFYLTMAALLFAPFIMNSQNLVTNGDFEQWDNSTKPTGWTVSNISEETSIIHGGAKSAAHTSAATYSKCLQKVNVTAGQDYTVSFWYYDSTTAAKIKLRTTWLAGNTNIGQSDVDLNPNDTVWHKYSAILTAPATATKVKIDIRVFKEVTFGGKVYYDDVYFGSVIPEPEPSNHVTNFIVTPHRLMASLTWNDAVGTTLPAGYLITGAKSGTTAVVPVDTVPVADDLDWSDGQVAISLGYGHTRYDFTDLDSSETYTFNIYPYSNSGSYINYKTDGTVPSGNITTERLIKINFEDFENTSAVSWDTFNVAGSAVWTFTEFQGRTTARIKSTNEANEDWLISPALDLTAYDTVMMSFENMLNGTGDSIRLMVSSNYSGSGDPTTATWTDITSRARWSSGNYAVVNTDSVELTDYVGGTIYVAFKFASQATQDYLYKIDNIQVFAVLPSTNTPDAIQDIQRANVAIYPNPAENNFFLKTEKRGSLELLDAVGRVVLNENIEIGLNNIELNDINKGVYIVHIILENGSESVSKLIVR